MMGLMKFTLTFLAFLLVSVSCQRADDSYRLALVAKSMDSEFWLSMREGAEEAARRAGVSLSVLAPQREVYIHEQVNILEDLLVRGLDALIVAPAGTAQVLPVLNRIADRNVPVIIVDTDLEWDRKLTYVGTDNREGGRLAGEFLARALPGGGNVALVRGIPGVASQDHRVEGFLKVLERHPSLTLVANQSGDSERSRAMAVIEDVLSAHRSLDAVFATNDEMALGVVEAISAHERQSEIIVIGFDAGQEALRALEEGRLEAVVAQNPSLMGQLSVEVALKALRGEGVEPVYDSGTMLVTLENLSQFKTRKQTAVLD